jgi:uncharacterized delta-60 repeat protein
MRRLLGVLFVASVFAFGMICWLTPVAAWAADGDLDAGFGAGGRVTTDFGGVDSINAAVLQPDGKIVVAGGLGESGFALARYGPDGNLDPSFGSGGKVVTAVGGHIQIAFALALQADGKLVATGNGGDDFATVRYNPDGSLDSTFGSSGEVVTVFGGWGGARTIALQPDGRTIVGGISGGPDNWHAVMARYLTDGSLDPTFGSGGMVSSQVGGTEIRLLGDGKILAVGLPGPTPAGFDFAVARFNADGTVDASFGTAGVATTGIAGSYDQASTLVVQPDGKIVAVGNSVVAGQPELALARFLPNGSLDTSLNGGKVVTDLGGINDSTSGIDVILQTDGKIVVSTCTNCYSAGDFALVRYNSDGTQDMTFGTGGRVTTDFSGGEDRSGALVVQPDGKLTAAGRAQIGGGSDDFALARYDAHGTPAVPVYAVATNTRSNSGNNNIVATIGATDVPAGDTATVSVATGTFAGVTGCHDSKGNTYTVAVDRNSGQGRLFVCTAHVASALTGGDTVTATYPTFSGISVVSVNAIAAGVSAGTVSAASSANGNSANPNSGNVTVGGPSVLFGAVAHNSTPTLTPGAGYTLVGQVSGGSGSSKRTVSPEFRLASGSGSYNATATIGNGGQFWQAAIVAYAGS